MTYRHVVVLQLKPQTSNEQRDRIVTELRALPGLIPALRAYSVGVDARLRDDNFDIAIVADFDDSAGFAQYRDHPEHLRVIKDHIAQHVSARAAVQHEAATLG